MEGSQVNLSNRKDFYRVPIKLFALGINAASPPTPKALEGYSGKAG